MRDVPNNPEWRWLRLVEHLPDNVLWYDEDPRGTNFSMEKTEHPDLHQVEFETLLLCHRRRHKDWPSDAHGLCGIVVPVSDEDSLKPCPFCGNRPSVHRYEDETMYAGHNITTHIEISCTGCDYARVHGEEDDEPTPFEEWNTRS